MIFNLHSFFSKITASFNGLTKKLLLVRKCYFFNDRIKIFISIFSGSGSDFFFLNPSGSASLVFRKNSRLFKFPGFQFHAICWHLALILDGRLAHSAQVWDEMGHLFNSRLLPTSQVSIGFFIDILHMCAICSELPPNTSTMIYQGIFRR